MMCPVVFIGGELKHGLLTGRVHLGNDHRRSSFTIVIKTGSCRVAKLCGQVFRNVICCIQPSLVHQVVMAQGGDAPFGWIVVEIS